VKNLDQIAVTGPPNRSSNGADLNLRTEIGIRIGGEVENPEWLGPKN
jgi:hypothetical protein